MGRQEQARRVEGGEAPAVGGVNTAAVGGADRSQDVAPRRPDEALSREAFSPPHLGIVNPLPVELELEVSSPRPPHVPAIRQSFLGAVNDLEKKLESYAGDTGNTVEPVSSRLLGSSSVARWWNRTSIAQWLGDKFPVYAYDISETREDGTEKQLCHVRISQRVFTGAVRVRVTSYKGGDDVAAEVVAALDQKGAPREATASGEKGVGVAQATHASQARRARGGVNSKLEDAIEARFTAEEDALDNDLAVRKRLGLSSLATEHEVAQMRDLVAKIKAAWERVRTGQAQLETKDDGSCVVMRLDYVLDGIAERRILRPTLFSWEKDPGYHWDKPSRRFETGIALGGLFIANFGIGIATTIIGVAIGSPTIAERGLVISLCPPWILPIAEVARTLVNFLIVEKLRGAAYLRGPLASKNPDSLGGVIDAIREAGLRVKVKALGHDCSDIQFGRIDDEEWPVSFEFSTMPDRRFARSQGRGSRD